MKRHHVLLIPGDGIGQIIVPEAARVVDAVGEVEGFSIDYEHADMGGVAYDKATADMNEHLKKGIDKWSDEEKEKLSLPQRTIEAMDRARDRKGAILFGAVGRPDLPKRVAELALLAMRKRYGLNNKRPFEIDAALAHNSILFREPVYVPGFTLVRTEESLFTGEHGGDEDHTWTRKPFTLSKLEKTVKNAFEQAKREGKKILCVSKYNVLLSEQVLSDVFERYAREYAGQVEFNEFSQDGQLIIDNAGMQLAANPKRYANTVVVADAMFGDFLQAIMDVVTGGKAVNKAALAEIKQNGLYRMFIRELCGGLYFGERKRTPEHVYDTMEYDRKTIEAIAKMAKEDSARLKSGSIDSLEIEEVPSFDFWARVLSEHSKKHGYTLRHYDVKGAVEQLLTNPSSFGTLIASNMMGDIFTDLAAAVVGKSLGMMASSEVNEENFGNYQQIAGSAPGRKEPNPIAEIRSAAMMLEDFGYPEAAQRIYGGIRRVLSVARTEDIHEPGYKLVGTREMTDRIIEAARSNN